MAEIPAGPRPEPMLAHGLTVAFRRETLAHALIREAIPPPYASIVIGVPLWVRQLAPIGR